MPIQLRQRPSRSPAEIAGGIKNQGAWRRPGEQKPVISSWKMKTGTRRHVLNKLETVERQDIAMSLRKSNPRLSEERIADGADRILEARRRGRLLPK